MDAEPNLVLSSLSIHPLTVLAGQNGKFESRNNLSECFVFGTEFDSE